MQFILPPLQILKYHNITKLQIVHKQRKLFRFKKIAMLIPGYDYITYEHMP